MAGSIRIEYRKRPAAVAYMAGAMRPSPGFGRTGGVPSITTRWSSHRAEARELEDFLALSGLPEGEHLPLLYPHTISFPLQMAILTHPAFPVPIWRVLQVRNHILQHAPLEKDVPFDLAVRVAAHRFIEKGVEIDLHAVASAGEQRVWEAVNTFYVRGRFGQPQQASPLCASPAADGKLVDQWRMPAGGGWRFGGLSGDYNGIHLWGWYARRFGFPRAFFHPQRVLGQCVARLPALDPAQPQRLDAWLKGPVYYGAQVSLRAGPEKDGTAFALYMNDEARPAIIGRLRRAGPGSRLTDETPPND